MAFFSFSPRNISYYFVTEENVTSLLIDDCNIDRSNTLSFRIILMQGVTFVLVSALISLYINKVDRKKLLSMTIKSIFIWKHFVWFNLRTTWSNFFWISVGWLLACSVFSVSIPLIPYFYVMAVCFMIFLSCGLCGGIISAISVTIFPTNIRWWSKKFHTYILEIRHGKHIDWSWINCLQNWFFLQIVHSQSINVFVIFANQISCSSTFYWLKHILDNASIGFWHVFLMLSMIAPSSWFFIFISLSLIEQFALLFFLMTIQFGEKISNLLSLLLSRFESQIEVCCISSSIALVFEVVFRVKVFLIWMFFSISGSTSMTLYSD